VPPFPCEWGHNHSKGAKLGVIKADCRRWTSTGMVTQSRVLSRILSQRRSDFSRKLFKGRVGVTPTPRGQFTPGTAVFAPFDPPHSRRKLRNDISSAL
jgi:hypothetical protein